MTIEWAITRGESRAQVRVVLSRDGSSSVAVSYPGLCDQSVWSVVMAAVFADLVARDRNQHFRAALAREF